VFTADRISAFLGFPVTVSESGELRAEAGRPLRFRENSLLRALALHTAETMQTAHLLADRLRLERELAEKEKLASLGEMAAFVAHRLKNPLSAINALVQVIAERSPEAAGHCQVIRGEIARLDTSVRDLLRFTAPPAPLSPAVTPARAAAEEAAALFSAEAARKGVRVEVQAEAADLPMAAGALHDVLVALLGNALDAAPAGSAIHLTWRPPILSVEDQGPGVPPVHGQRIFDPFFTQKSGGTGLGLAIARRRCQEAGAEIRCISPANDGRGARFEIVFPHR
jgi:signal transduction histidine kinase